jgi:DNA-binding transcriptional LysR family regulator
VPPSEDISLRHLRILSLMLQEHSLTRAAEILDCSQSVISKVLSRLRQQFGDPLFVRVGLTMQPTPKALQLQEALRALLAASDRLHASDAPFDPASSDREFALIVTDVGMVRFLPELMRLIEREGSQLRLRALPLELGQLETRLESGAADVALGAFPRAMHLRRQRLYADSYVGVARRDHPRLSQLGELPAFRAERHVVVTASSAGHAAHQMAQKALEAAVAAEHIQLRLPSFVAAAAVAARTDTITVMPANLADTIAEPFALATFRPPLALPRIEIAQFWHERHHRDPAHRWLRATIRTLFAGQGSAPPPA